MTFNIFELLSVVLSALLIVLGWMYSRRTEEMKIMRSQLSGRKHQAYAEIVGAFFSVLKDIKSNHHTDMEIMGEKIMNAKRDIFMYGSDEVFRAFNNWLVYSNSSKPSERLEAYFAFILSIRKDIYGKTKINKDDIILNLVQNKEELKNIKNMLKSKM